MCQVSTQTVMYNFCVQSTRTIQNDGLKRTTHFLTRCTRPAAVFSIGSTVQFFCSLFAHSKSSRAKSGD